MILREITDDDRVEPEEVAAHLAAVLICADDATLTAALEHLPTPARAHLTQVVAAATLHDRALHDDLTGLPNRALLSDRLERAMARAHREGTEVAVLFLDLDHFKVVNDSRGHGAGDTVLRAVAQRLPEAVRPTDTVARFGGDEFVVVCEDAGHWEASLLARRIAERLEVPIDVDGTALVMSASIGVAVGDATADPEALIRDADAAMYHAKERGRSRAEIFDTAMHARTERRLSIETALRQAVADERLRVAYQPIVSLATGETVGAEALLRWDDADPSWAAPEVFVAVAESSGLIEPIGTWVLNEVGNQLLAWGDALAGVPDFFVSVNISSHQLRPQLFDTLRGLVRRGLDPRRLSLELTETVLMGDAESSVEALVGLKAVGMRLAIDDFGTGYSSLAYLHRFPIDALKIDRMFITGLATDEGDAAIVKAVVAMAHSLGISVVAEGVETAADLDELGRLGCEMGQGFYWRPAVTAEELEGLVLRQPFAGSQAIAPSR